MNARTIRRRIASHLALLAMALHVGLPLLAQAQTDARLLPASQVCSADGARAAAPALPGGDGSSSPAAPHPAGHCLLCLASGERPLLAAGAPAPLHDARARTRTAPAHPAGLPPRSATHRPSQPRAPPIAA